MAALEISVTESSSETENEMASYTLEELEKGVITFSHSPAQGTNMSKVTLTITDANPCDPASYGGISLNRENDEINSADFGMYAPTINPNNTKAWLVGNMVARVAADLMQMSMEDLRKAKVVLEPPTTEPTEEPDRCEECGMPTILGEYHPYTACLMFKGCKDADMVRTNLKEITNQWKDIGERSERENARGLHPSQKSG